MPTPSLLIVPARFKSGKLYSQIPTSGAGDFTVTRATAATRVNASGLIESVASGIPRLDYFASGGTVGCPALLVEPSASNLLLQSAGFEVSGTWSPTNITITTGSTAAFTAPDGTTNADLLTSTSSVGSSFISQTITVASGTSSLSVFAKAGNYGLFRIGNVSSVSRAAWFNLNAGVVTGTVNGGTASMQNYGNGWYRCVFTPTTTVSGSDAYFIGISSATNGTTGLSGSTIYFWGAQLETGSVATSYIPTTTGSITRNADVISVSGAVSGSIGQTEGTLYAEAYIRKISDAFVIAIMNTGIGDAIYLQVQSNGDLFGRIRNSGTIVTLTIAAANWSEGYHKVAIAYATGTGNSAICLDGGTPVTGTVVNMPACTTVVLGSRPDVPGTLSLNDRIRAAALYTTRLTNAQLQALTSP